MSQTISTDECIRHCQECSITCASMLTEHCLREGGPHVEPQHVQTMLDCIAACRASIEFMARNSRYHAQYCRICAEICRACAESCERVGDMDRCVESCRRCAHSCAAMADA
jgi:hypothetical protein